MKIMFTRTPSLILVMCKAGIDRHIKVTNTGILKVMAHLILVVSITQ